MGFWRGNLSPFLAETMSNVHVDPIAAQPGSSKQTKGDWQTWRYNAKISKHCH